MHNELGLRNVTFEVDDLQAILDRLAADGYHLVGGVGQYEGIWRMASVRGPEGFIVNLAQPINGSAPRNAVCNDSSPTSESRHERASAFGLASGLTQIIRFGMIPGSYLDD